MDFCDFCDFCVAVIETGLLLSPFSDTRGTGLTQPGGVPTEWETGSTVSEQLGLLISKHCPGY